VSAAHLVVTCGPGNPENTSSNKGETMAGTVPTVLGFSFHEIVLRLVKQTGAWEVTCADTEEKGTSKGACHR